MKSFENTEDRVAQEVLHTHEELEAAGFVPLKTEVYETLDSALAAIEAFRHSPHATLYQPGEYKVAHYGEQYAIYGKKRVRSAAGGRR